MKEIDTKKNNLPIQGDFQQPCSYKDPCRYPGFCIGVKNLLRQKEDKQENPDTDINNYLKSPAEIEAELRVTGNKQNEAVPVADNFIMPQFLMKPAPAANVKTLEEALSGEMEENY